jgi:hypothetical protein
MVNRWVLFAAGLLGIGATSSAEAQEPERIRLDYEATPGCADRDALVAEIARQAPRAGTVDDGEDGRRFRVRIARDGSFFVVDLEIREGDGEPVGRRFSTETCAQATRALGLTIALSVDPQNAVSPPAAP